MVFKSTASHRSVFCLFETATNNHEVCVLADQSQAHLVVALKFEWSHRWVFESGTLRFDVSHFSAIGFMETSSPFACTLTKSAVPDLGTATHSCLLILRTSQSILFPFVPADECVIFLSCAAESWEKLLSV